MELFDVIAVLVTLTALASYFNHRYVRLHPSVGVMLVSLVMSLGLIVLGKLGFGVRSLATDYLSHVEFDQALLHWMLGFLLFAGALTVDLGELARQWGVTVLLATAGTVLSMFIVAALIWPAFYVVGAPLPWIACLLFGALISPTDPVAVVAVMKTSGAPRSIETVVAAESLFNDGVGVVLFLTLAGVDRSNAAVGMASVLRLLFQQTFGGAALGFVTGLITYQFLKRAQNFQVQVLLTLALVMGTYSLAENLGMSGPIAVVVAGLLIGNRGRIFSLPESLNKDLYRVWELIEEILNAILFVLIGLEILAMQYTARHFLAALAAIPIVLAARWLSVFGTIKALSFRRKFSPAMLPILTWGGLRGGLAIAMALSLPAGVRRSFLVAVTYGVVTFSILIQGTTIRMLVGRALKSGGRKQEAVVHT
jgi:monovalent cation:H+ antiporter, CPA1 family